MNSSYFTALKSDLLKAFRNINKKHFSQPIITQKLKPIIGNHRVQQGAFACCYIPYNANYVIKLIRKNSNKSYISYAVFCKDNHRKNGIYNILPKIYDIFSNESYEFIIMEKLRLNANKAKSFINKYIEYDYDYELIASKFNPYKKVLSEIKYIKQFYAAEYDLHSHNVMIRHDGSVVITDPLA